MPVGFFFRPLAVSISASCSRNEKQALASRSSLFVEKKKLVLAFLIGLQSPKSPSAQLGALTTLSCDREVWTRISAVCQD